jgi:hypothetical protein
MIAAQCPGKRIGRSLYIFGPVPDAVREALPGYTECTYDFARWDAPQ